MANNTRPYAIRSRHNGELIAQLDEIRITRLAANRKPARAKEL